MLSLSIVLLLLILLAFVAMKWGHDSRDGLESEEWERRSCHGWLL